MNPFIRNLGEMQEGERSQAGGKGYALARLRRAGFPVPPGFVVTTDAYRAFVAANGLERLLADALAEDDPAAASACVRAAFQGAEMPPAVAAAVDRAYRVLGTGPVAVRSSAAAEDGGRASFAGQHDTVLGVVGTDALLAAVRRCWASLWSERAMAYRRARGIEAEPAMAVVVQRMVDAAQAGVAFTLDPVSGREDVVVVEAVEGWGDGLAGGEAEPRRYIVRRGDDCRTLGDGLLDGARLAAIVHLAREVEAWAGRPQDMEWALDRAGRVHLLQARLATVAPRVVVRWTRDNVGEVVPDPVTPLSWSVLEPLGNTAFAGVLRRLGMGRVSVGLFGRFYGRVYLNQTLFQAVMGRFYISHAGWWALPRLALMGLRALGLLWRLPGEGRAVVGAILAQRRAEEGLDLTTLPAADLLDQVETWQGLGVRVMEVHLAVTVMAELLYQVLDKGLSRYADGCVTAATLTAGLTGVRSAEVGRALAALAWEVGQDKELRDLVLGTVAQALPARLAETGPGRALWARIEAFLAEHGHGAVQEFELAAPRWRDDPTAILSALQAQVRAAGEGPAVDPAAVRIAATARIERRLNPLRRRLFRRLLRWAWTFTLARENLKYHFVLAHSRLRDLYLAIAVRLVAEGRLEDREDIFFLTTGEVAELVGGEWTPEEGRRRVVERRRAWEGYRKGVPPRALDQRADGRLCQVAPPVAPKGGDGPLLRGLAASPGTYIGRARVVRTVDDGADLEPGEVLVAPATSPGWAPLLVAAGALVTEAGGILSHGAIIAREYGLPAVLNVGDAARRIRTGQLVHVDGSAGIVRLLEGVEAVAWPAEQPLRQLER